MTDYVSPSLALAKENNDKAKELYGRVESELAEIDGMKIHANVSFPLIENALMEMQSNLDHVSNRIWNISRIEDSLENGKAAADYVKTFGAFLCKKIRLVGSLKEKGEYDEALNVLEGVKIPSELDSLKSVATFKQIKPWIRANLLIGKAESMIAYSTCPLSDEEFENLKSLIGLLPIGIHGERDKQRLLDRVEGIYFLRSTYLLDGIMLDSSVLEPLVLGMQEYQYHQGPSSSLTKWRYNTLRYKLVRSYNKGCEYHFYSNPEYKEALCFFRHKPFFHPEEIDVDVYRSCEDEDAFRVAFLRADMLRKEGTDFYEENASIAATVKKEGDVSAMTLAKTFCDPELGEERKSMLLKEFKRSTFLQKVLLFDACVSEGITEEDELALLSVLESPKKLRKADLEQVATPMLRLRKNLRPASLKRFEEVVNSLFRSPLAIKITVKTPLNDVRTLSKRGYQDPPKGVKFASKPVKAHSIASYVFSWIFAIVVCLAVATAGFIAIHLYSPMPLRSYLYMLPPFFIHGFIVATISRYCGLDERGSAYARRVFGGVFFLLAVLTLLYFIFPNELIALKDFGYALIIGTAVLTFSTMIFLKDYKRKFGFWTYWPTMLVLVASLVFLILDMMNGLI